MSEARIGTFEELVALTPEPLRPTIWRAREIVLAIDAAACEVVRLGDRAATYGVGPRKMIEGYAYLMPQRAWVNLGFYQGAALPDPAAALEGTGAKLRHIKLRSPEDAERREVRALIEEAVAERRRALGG